jgi:Leucine-rich repeat (LRR) protein
MVLAARDKKAALEREQAERQEVERKKALLDLQMRALARFKNLEILVLDGETSWRLAELQDLTKLKEFHVQGHSLKDSDVVYLQGMVDMEILDLAVSDISDAGLVYLHGMSRLRELDVSYTKVTAEGEANLKRVLPSVRIRRK